MANALYSLGKKKLLDADIDLLVDNIKVVLVNTASYTANLATDEFLAIIPEGMRVATSANLGTKTTTLGVFDAADFTFSSVTGAQSEALVVYKDTADPATSPLIAYIDTATGLPITPNSNDINIHFNASGIFAI
jgi:hypothetical protein